MNLSNRTALLALGFALALGAYPASAKQLDPTGGDAQDRLFYLVHAERLGNPAEIVNARIEYRSGARILAVREYPLSLAPTEERLIAFPAPASFLDLAAQTEPVELHIFAGKFLLNTFDLASMASYSKTLSYKFPEVSALQALRRALEGGGAASGPSLGGSGTNVQCVGGGCGPYDDYDYDGVLNAYDNCIDYPNGNQSDCDNDGYGDVCDALDATYQNTGPVDTCFTDKDGHIYGNDFEHHVEQVQQDVSSCGAPNRWDSWIRSDGFCDFSYSDKDCCLYAISSSIAQVGDNPTQWCGVLRNFDYCH